MHMGPMIGEQGKDILKEIGYTDEEISNLINNKTLYIMQ